MCSLIASVSLLQKSDPVDEAASLAQTQTLQTWCCFSHLEINMTNTKELIICTKQGLKTVPVSLDGQHIEVPCHVFRLPAELL